MKGWILVWRLFKKFLLIVIYEKYEKFETLQNTNYLIINFQNLDMKSIKKQSK